MSSTKTTTNATNNVPKNKILYKIARDIVNSFKLTGIPYEPATTELQEYINDVCYDNYMEEEYIHRYSPEENWRIYLEGLSH